MRHEAGAGSTTASRSSRCSTSSPTCRSRARLRGLIVDDLNFSTDPRSTVYGEKAGVPFAPVGIYDFTNRLVTTVESDYNGMFDVLLPSTNRINCPTPSGVCANMYRFVGNDPGVPGRLNPNYNPRFRTIAAEFEALPGLIIPTDLAPTQVGVTDPGRPATGITSTVDLPRLDAGDSAALRRRQALRQRHRLVHHQRAGLRRHQGHRQVTLDGTALPTTAWSDTTITASVTGRHAAGPHQLEITAGNGQTHGQRSDLPRPGNGLQPRRLRGRSRQDLRDHPGRARRRLQCDGDDLVVVYPARRTVQPARQPARRLLREPDHRLRPGQAAGRRPGQPRRNGSSRLDHRRRRLRRVTAPSPPTGTPEIWPLTWAGNQSINDGAVISIYRAEHRAHGLPGRAFSSDGPRRRSTASTSAAATSRASPATSTTSAAGPPDSRPNLITQGGAIFANAYARNLQITNNVVQNNGGAYGTIRIGTPDLPGSDTSNHNEGIRIANNRIIANAGTNLAGGIGIFAGADGYEVARNDICGNFSAEYGGGVTVYGLAARNGDDPPQPHLLQPVLRRGRRHHDRRRAAGRPRPALPRHRRGEHPRQPDPGQPRQRRRRRPPLPDGRQLPDERLEQHDHRTTSRPTRAAASRSTTHPTCASSTTRS